MGNKGINGKLRKLIDVSPDDEKLNCHMSNLSDLSANASNCKN